MADCLFPVVNANFTDTRWTLLQKILCGTNAIVAGGGSSSTSNLSGDVDPGGVVVATVINQQYRNRVTNSTWWATALGTGGWEQVT